MESKQSPLHPHPKPQRQQGSPEPDAVALELLPQQACNIPTWSGCVGMLFLAVAIIHHVWAVGMLGYLQGCNVATLQRCLVVKLITNL